MKQDDAQPHLQNGSSSSDIIADASTTEQKSVSSATCAKASDEERNAKLKEKAAVQSLGMLEYENQMFLEILEEDALVVTGRGMCLHRVLTALFACYSDPGNLVLILGTNQLEQEYFINQMRLRGVEHLPRVITADQTVAERSIIYLEGGVIFVTARILVLDLLKDQIPTDLITGVIVNRAHRILESCVESFILRLYRQKNKKGFVKAFTSSPTSFGSGFSKVNRVMRNLFVGKLKLWPRFQRTVQDVFQKSEPEVVEIGVVQSEDMMVIQTALLDLLTKTISELKNGNRGLGLEELAADEMLVPTFRKRLASITDPVIHQLSPRSKQQLRDISTLATLASALIQYDCVTFLTLVESVGSTERLMRTGGWIFHPSAETLFVTVRNRVLKPGGKSLSDKKYIKDLIELPLHPKWKVLSEVVEDILKSYPATSVDKETPPSSEQASCSAGKETKPLVLLLAREERTCLQLQEVLADGPTSVFKRILQTQADVALNSSESGLFVEDVAAEAKKSDPKGRGAMKRAAAKDIPANQNPRFSCPETGILDLPGSVRILMCATHHSSDPFNLVRILEERVPQFVILYDPDIEPIRTLEVFHAVHPNIPLRIYVLMFEGSVEEQAYLTALKKEKDAFNKLIKDKVEMVVPEDAEGRLGDHPELCRDPTKASEQTKAETMRSTAVLVSAEDGATIGAGGDQGEPMRVIVDVRELRSALPSLLHKRGLEIDPVTLEVGDYILTPSICVERKSLSDLIQSLQSGRLYNQAVAMTRTYENPMLLIEFDQDKPFALNYGQYFYSRESSSSDVTSRLQLLTLHFPKLKILWSPGPFATAEMFHQLKIGKPQPDAETAIGVRSEEIRGGGRQGEGVLPDSKYNPVIRDFIFKLPGINTKNEKLILNNFNDLKHLMSQSEEDLNKLLGNSVTARVLHAALHSCLGTQSDGSSSSLPEESGFVKAWKRRKK